MIAIPELVGDASPTFVTEALRDGGAIDSDSSVAEVSVQQIGEGVGIVGQLARLTLRYEGQAERAPSSVILKIPSEYPQNRGIGDHYNFYEREGRFYQQLAGKVGVRTPSCYFNHIDTESNSFALMLEDFGERTMISQIAGIGVERALESVRAIAAVHAEFWASPRLDGLDWMPSLDAPINMSAGEQYRKAWPVAIDLLGDALSPDARALGERIKEAWEQVNQAGCDASPTTVCHGDFRVDNLMFDDTAADAERVGVIDWQISYQGPGISDICYLLTQSMDPEVCRESERTIVDTWYDTVSEHLGGSPAGYSRHDAWTEYRRTLLGVTVYPISGAGSMDPANERGRQLVEAMARRSFEAALALDAGEFLPN